MAHHVRILALALAVLVTAMDAGAQPRCRFLKVVEWPVRLVANHIVVDGAINGQAISIMLDTGATVSSIERQTAEFLKLPLRDAPGRRIVGIGGQVQAALAVVDEFKLGEVATQSLQLLVTGDGTRRRPWDVILGEDFLQRFDVEFDLAHDAVRLFQPRDCDGVSLAYWTKEGVAEVEIDALRDSQPRIEFVVRVNERKVDAMLDSGAGVSIISLADVAALGITPESPGVVPAGMLGGLGERRVAMYAVQFASFTIGNESIPDIRIAFGDVWKDTALKSLGSNVGKRLSAQEPMIVGADFLRAHRLLVAHSQRRMYFSYVGGPVFAVPVPRAPPAAPAKSAASERMEKSGSPP